MPRFRVSVHSTEMHFASFLSGRFITAIVVNSPERKLAKCTSVECTEVHFASFRSGEFTTLAVINQPEKKLAKRTSMHSYKKQPVKKIWGRILDLVWLKFALAAL